MTGTGRPGERTIVSGNLDQVVRRIDADVNLAGIVINVIRVRVNFPLPANRFQQFAVNEDHVVVEAPRRSFCAFPFPPPPVRGFGREQM
jgi:hypothetical protein